MQCNVGRLKYLHWEGHLVKMVDLREALPMGFQAGMVLENLRVHNLESHLVHNMELM